MTTPKKTKFAPTYPTIQLLRRKEVLDKLGRSNRVLKKLIDSGDFPPPIILGLRWPCWRECDVDAAIMRLK